MTLCNISPASVRSAAIFFKGAFSSTSAFCRRILSGGSPLYREIPRLDDAHLAADLRDRRAFLAPLQNKSLLRYGELRCLHAISHLSQPQTLTRKLQLRTKQFSAGRAPMLRQSECIPSDARAAALQNRAAGGRQAFSPTLDPRCRSQQAGIVALASDKHGHGPSGGKLRRGHGDGAAVGQVDQ